MRFAGSSSRTASGAFPVSPCRATKLRAYSNLPSVQHYLIVWPDELRIVRHARMSNDHVATPIFVPGEFRLDPPGITVTVEEFHVD